MSEKIKPMGVHKSQLVFAIRKWPEDFKRFTPQFGSAEEAVAAIVAHPGEWIVGGELLDPEDPRNPKIVGEEGQP